MTNPEIKPIETEYAGCRFRSRLEARWAVWLDQLCIEWLYEPERFEVGPPERRRSYLPDFYLPDLDVWLEVKGRLATGDLQLFIDAGHLTTGLPVPAFKPLPVRPNGLRLVILEEVPRLSGLHGGIVAVDGKVGKQLVTPYCELPSLRTAAPHRHVLQTMYRPAAIDDAELSTNAPLGMDCTFGFGCEQVLAAYRAARSARFEHGESGAPAPKAQRNPKR